MKTKAGERVSTMKKDNLLSVVILPGIDSKKLALLFLWLFAWSVCGIIVFMNYFRADTTQQKLFIIGYLSFWLYFEIVMLRSFMWKRAGKEKLWIKDGIMHYQRELHGGGKIRTFPLDLVSPLELLELKPSRFADTFNQSFWVKGGERLMFTVQGKTILLGMQLDDRDAKFVRDTVNKFVAGKIAG